MSRLSITLVFLVITVATFSQTSLPIQPASTYPQLFSFSLFNVQNGKTDNRLLTNSKSFYVYVFLSPECPLCQHYIPELKGLQEKYKENIVINGIVPGMAYGADVLTKFINEYKINFPVYIDSLKQLTNYLKANVTPEVMLFNNTTEKI